MSNKYGLPEEEVERVRRRDKRCVYCQKKMAASGSKVWRGDWATIEHLNHLPPWNNPRTIAICCHSCNASRGKKPILEWFQTDYCVKRKITPDTVAQPVLNYIKEFEGFEE